MHLQKPKFKFCLFVVSSEKSTSTKTVCMADSYDIQQDGSITFYQIAVRNDKHIKLPVLSYPRGKWESCVLMDDNDDFPVFSNGSHFSSEVSQQQVQQPKRIQSVNARAAPDNDFDDLDSLSNSLSNSPSHHSGSAHHVQQSISQVNDPQEFKKLRDEWLEKLIMDYTRANDFNVIQFMQSLADDPQLKVFKPSENDVIWTAAGLIKNRLVLSRKFSNPLIQKQFDLILSGIMKRLWDGNMSPILETLQDKEETKDANAIDLAVWMSRNNY